MYCSQLRATAKPFLPTLKQDSCIVVRSLVSLDEGEALVPVDPISRQVGLNDIREHFPAADGLHFIQQKADGSQRLVSVCHSFGIVEDQNENICYGDKKFIPPTLGFSRIYYVTERGIQVEAEDVAMVEDMIDEVEDLLVGMKDKLSRLSRLCDGLKALKFSACSENIRQISPAVVCEPRRSFDVDEAFYQYRASVTQNTKICPTSFNFSPRENVEEKTFLGASVICQSKPECQEASSDAEIETSKTDEVKDAPEKTSSRREIMMMVEGKEVNIISVRPKLIKKKC